MSLGHSATIVALCSCTSTSTHAPISCTRGGGGGEEEEEERGGGGGEEEERGGGGGGFNLKLYSATVHCVDLSRTNVRLELSCSLS